MKYEISQKAKRMTSSAIRELLKIVADPAVISFAGGIPAPQTFPHELIREAANRLLTDEPESVLQYAPTDGFRPLREWIGEQHGVSADRVLITTGSQQALDLVAKILIDPGSRVLVEDPSYLGALQAFTVFEPTLVPIACDENGIIPAALVPEVAKGARFLYLIPNFQNPTGRRMPLARRELALRALEKSDVIVVEDNPYGELTYDGQSFPSLLSMAPERVIYMGSFSKVVAPGLRVGYVIAPTPLINKLVQAKQASDLHTSSLSQRLVYEVVRSGIMPEHLLATRTLYREQRDAMLASLDRHCKSLLEWNVPQGGMFLWGRILGNVHATQLLEALLAETMQPRVAFVPGAPFFAHTPDPSALRLSFVTVPKARIEEGVAQIARVLRRLEASVAENSMLVAAA
jgi:2-aminoadipate transaminase